MMIFKKVMVQATKPFACDNESLDYDDEDVIHRRVFDAVREDPAYFGRMLDIASVATEIDDGAAIPTCLTEPPRTRLGTWAIASTEPRIPRRGNPVRSHRLRFRTRTGLVC
jgi:hypothetical protein